MIIAAYHLNLNLQTVMKRVIQRNDLLKKAEYSKRYGINRPKLDQMIEDGLLVVERISNTDYVRIQVS